MKICEAINQTDQLIPNSFDRKQKIQWLSEVDGLICKRVLENYDGYIDTFEGYSEHVDMDTALLVSAPYDGIYVLWLEAKIAYYNGDMDRYDNAYTMFNQAVETFGMQYNRTHMPKNSGTWKW